MNSLLKFRLSSIIFLLALLIGQGEVLAQKTNILLITADDMNWNSVGVYNSTLARTTPNIDQLASEGMRFDYAYVQMAMCTPSRQVMLSGNHSHQTMTRGFTEIERLGPALPDILKANGYFIANLNKEQDFYEWDRAVTETSTGMGRDIPYHGQVISEIISEAGQKPWFIMMNFNDPHRPFFTENYEELNDKYKKLYDEGKTII